MNKNRYLLVLVFILLILVSIMFACNKKECLHENKIDCVCADCGETLHNINEQCTCTECGATFHDYKNCICTECGQENHSVVDCVCTECGVAVHNPTEACVCKDCLLEAHTVDDDCKCTVCEETYHLSNSLYCRHGDTVYFGTYPQSKLSSRSEIASMLNMQTLINTSKADPFEDWVSYNYHSLGSEVEDLMYYKDLNVNNDKYRVVFINKYRPSNAQNLCVAENSMQDDDGFELGKHYFKFELIKWKVIAEKDGELTLVSDKIHNNQPYRVNVNENGYLIDNNGDISDTGYANGWRDSYVRGYLNTFFLNTAFTAQQRKAIITTTVDNKTSGELAESHAYSKEQVNTKDKIYLMSFKDCFTNGYDIDLKKVQTDYALSQCDNSRSNDYWLRSAWSYKVVGFDPAIRTIDENGALDYACQSQFTMQGGVVPMLSVKF